MSKHLSRRNFLKGSAMAVGAVALTNIAGGLGSAFSATDGTSQGKSQVFFTKEITPDGLLKLYSRVNQGISGKVGIKLHTGEPNGPNLLPRELAKALQANVPNSVIIETNTLYTGKRYTTEDHRNTLAVNGWDFCPVDIMDAEGEVMWPIPGMREFLGKFDGIQVKERPFKPGAHLTELAVGKSLANYDSLVVYTHFKGHAMGGFGGSLKNVSIGCASGRGGKHQIHGEGWPLGELFLERMVEGGKAITEHFGPKITYINVLKNMSVDCDCDPNGAKPEVQNLGILASTDILAIDHASVDMVYALPEAERRPLVERIESRKGLHQLSYMKTLNMGNAQYELITL